MPKVHIKFVNANITRSEYISILYYIGSQTMSVGREFQIKYLLVNKHINRISHTQRQNQRQRFNNIRSVNTK